MIVEMIKLIQTLLHKPQVVEQEESFLVLVQMLLQHGAEMAQVLGASLMEMSILLLVDYRQMVDRFTHNVLSGQLPYLMRLFLLLQVQQVLREVVLVHQQ